MTQNFRFSDDEIKSDREFCKFLYGGIHDLNPRVRRLVYNCYRHGIKTTWSNEGFVDKWLADSADTGACELTASAGYLSFDSGKLYYLPDEKAGVLGKLLENIVLENSSFASLKLNKFDSPPVMYFDLDFKDIADLVFDKNQRKKALFAPEEKARERMQQIYKIWEELTTETEKWE